LKTLPQIITLTTLLFTLTSFAVAGSIRWHNYSSSVFSQAKKQRKTVMLFAMSDTCHWCQEMIDTTFRNAAVTRTINRYFYPVMLHADRDRRSFKQLGLIGIPTIVFFNRSGNAKGTYEGYLKTSVMLRRLSEMR
tara:strand:+ start:2700 stop:3104 length:405 start_codon:yes stop_codon:yes gene_type:complete